MKIEEVNEMLRTMITKKIEEGWQKTKIGKVLLGANGQAHLNHFLKVEDNGDIHNIGVKPLQKIASTIDYDVRLVFTPKGESDQVNMINNQNLMFLNELSTALHDYLSGNITITQTESKNNITVVLDELFDSFEV